MNYLLIVVAIILTGCASADVTGDSTERDYTAPVHIENTSSGTVSLTINLNASSEQQTATKQTTDNDPVISPDTSASLAETGSTANATLGAAAKGLVRGVSNLFQPDNRTDNSTSTESVVSQPSGQSDTGIAVNEEVEIIKLRPIDNNGKVVDPAVATRSFEWLTETGAKNGKNILFTFDNNCGQLLVPDGTNSHTPSGTVSDHNQIVYFCGTDFPEGAPENNQRRASIFTAPGCVSKTVTITRTK